MASLSSVSTNDSKATTSLRSVVGVVGVGGGIARSTVRLAQLRAASSKINHDGPNSAADLPIPLPPSLTATR
jgi:hypothetical protein